MKTSVKIIFMVVLIASLAACSSIKMNPKLESDYDYKTHKERIYVSTKAPKDIVEMKWLADGNIYITDFQGSRFMGFDYLETIKIDPQTYESIVLEEDLGKAFQDEIEKQYDITEIKETLGETIKDVAASAVVLLLGGRPDNIQEFEFKKVNEFNTNSLEGKAVFRSTEVSTNYGRETKRYIHLNINKNSKTYKATIDNSSPLMNYESWIKALQISPDGNLFSSHNKLYIISDKIEEDKFISYNMLDTDESTSLCFSPQWDKVALISKKKDGKIWIDLIDDDLSKLVED